MNDGATHNPANTGLYQYTGQMWIAAAGVYHSKNRAYHPGLMRFMQTDPIGHSGGMNLYAYVGGDPVNFTDPWGLSRLKNPKRETFDHCRPIGTKNGTQYMECWNNAPGRFGFGNSGGVRLFGGGPGGGGGGSEDGGDNVGGEDLGENSRNALIRNAVDCARRAGMVPERSTWGYDDRYGFMLSNGLILGSESPEYPLGTPIFAAADQNRGHVQFYRGAAEGRRIGIRHYNTDTGSVSTTVSPNALTAQDVAYFVAGHEFGGHINAGLLGGLDPTDPREAQADGYGAQLLRICRR